MNPQTSLVRTLTGIVCSAVLVSALAAPEPSVVSAGDFGAPPNTREDATFAVRSALDHCRDTGCVKVVFPKGEYHFWPDRAYEEFLFVSNNDDGLRRIVFLLAGFDVLEIDGHGSEFIFHGEILPFVVERSADIELRNFSIDWEVPFHCEGEVLAVDKKKSTVDVRVFEGFSYRIHQGRFVFAGEGFENPMLKNFLEFDPVKRETAYQVTDNFQRTTPHRVEEIGPRTLRFEAVFRTFPKPGNTLLILQDQRICPAITISESSRVAIEDVNIYHSGAMGVIGQVSNDITLRRVKVTPRPGANRLVSTTVDATHFVDCRGHILMDGCEFSHHIDDATNVHGIQGYINRRLDGHAVEMKLMHFQQQGIPIAAPGSTMRFVRESNLETYHEGVVAQAKRLNHQYWHVRFREPIPADIQQGDVLENLTNQADLTIRNCRAGKNRARGFLIKTQGKVLIEGNQFHTPGHAISMGHGISTLWYESGGVRDVTIRNNVFDDCTYGVWGSSVISVGVGSKGAPPASAKHRNVTIEGNTFRVFDKWLLSARGVNGLRFVGNTVEKTDTYPPYQKVEAPITAEHVDNLVVTGNTFAGIDFGQLADMDDATRQTATVSQ